jgi:hypothetical protein
MLNEQSSPEVRDLVYLIFQEAEYQLTPVMRQDLQKHFEEIAKQPEPSALAMGTATRLNFRISTDAEVLTTAA